jgi:hypothetical protein
MSFTATVSDCDDYYKPNNHLNAYDWRSYDPDVQSAAFNQAQRELEVSLGGELTDPVTGDTYNSWYALFEQTLYILMNTARQEVDGIENVIDIADEESENKKNPVRQGVLISPQAQRYLGVNRIKMSRG